MQTMKVFTVMSAYPPGVLINSSTCAVEKGMYPPTLRFKASTEWSIQSVVSSSMNDSYSKLECPTSCIVLCKGSETIEWEIRCIQLHRVPLFPSTLKMLHYSCSGTFVVQIFTKLYPQFLLTLPYLIHGPFQRQLEEFRPYFWRSKRHMNEYHFCVHNLVLDQWEQHPANLILFSTRMKTW